MNIDHHEYKQPTITTVVGTQRQRTRILSALKESAANDPTVVRNEQHADIRPNDICPCGSGKKFKKCHQYQ